MALSLDSACVCTGAFILAHIHVVLTPRNMGVVQADTDWDSGAGPAAQGQALTDRQNYQGTLRVNHVQNRQVW